MRLLLFDDRRADGWHPFSLSRPATELRFGSLLQRRRLERWAGREASAVFSRPWLSRFREEGTPPVRPRSASDPDRAVDDARLWLVSRFVPTHDAPPPPGEGPVVLRCGPTVVGCLLPSGTPEPPPEWLAAPDGEEFPALRGAASVDVAGTVLGEPWEMVEHGADRLRGDLEALTPAATLRSAADLPPGVNVIGDGRVHLDDDATLEPGVVLDVRQGAIRLDRGVEVRGPARLEGPLWAGPGSRLLGGELSRLAAGPVSYLRGEIADVTTLGWVNKAHDGYVGHSYLGRWVNLGAGTVTSDLKNNYGAVRVGGPEGDRETDLLKMGALVGDHVKTAIGTLLATGAAIGAGANLFGATRAPRWVPPFRWGIGPESPRHRRDAFLATAAAVMARRDVSLDEDGRAWLEAVWEEARRRDGTGA